ncbi:hypothetical protein ACIHFD_49105 [Nonomuraea sp. NPDC051941]|uniref:hypothetical protein n=1 Tax=Nonomuraea sp. NPDC051941 TaxID=3364373 RepID=UPI0037C65236
MTGLIPSPPGWRVEYADADLSPLPVVAWAALTLGLPHRLSALVAVPGCPYLVPATEAGTFVRFLAPGQTTPAEDQAEADQLNANLAEMAETGLL